MVHKSSSGRSFKRFGFVAAATLGVTGAIGALTLSGTAGAATASVSEPKPTIVLEHGAFADASSWNG
ncbi:alpha/beta hydrolase, partial [Streptomyces sp. NPDC002870]